MNHFIPLKSIGQSFNECINHGLIDPEKDTTIIFYDHDFLKAKIQELNDSFPSDTLHTSAVKANPLVNVLEEVNALGLGAEVASEGELYLAQKAGFGNRKIILDSPAKTMAELTYALKNNIHINADSLMELDKIAKLKQTIDSE